jgi:non-homologous end joining protein Ku
VRQRVEKLIAQKLKGKDITAATPSERPPAPVIDLMEALKASLGTRGRAGGKSAPRRGPASVRAMPARAAASPARVSAPRARAAGGRKK